MKNEDFKKLDDELMKKTEFLRDRSVNPELLKGFSASVERKIKAKHESAPSRPMGFRVAVPVFAVLILVFVLVTKFPMADRSIPGMSLPEIELAALPESVLSSEAALTEEIETLRELGAWTSEDEAATGVTDTEE